MIEPSTSSTIECTIDCGCTTTSIWLGATCEQPMRLDDLEALVHQRRRIDRDLRPHAPRRMPQRVVWRDVAEARGRQLAERPARRGQDEAPDVARLRGRGRTGEWRCARCRPAAPRRHARRARSMTIDPAMTRISLFASAMVLPAVDGGEHRVEARRCRRTRTGRRRRRDAWRRQRDPRRRTPSSAAAAAPRASSAGCISASASGRRAWRPYRDGAARPARRSRGTFSPADERDDLAGDPDAPSTTASALWPMEPVDPRMATRFMWSGRLEIASEDVEHGRREEPAVDAIEHAAVSGDQR